MPRLPPIPLDMLLWAYSQGMFPMAQGRRAEAKWYTANPRAILPLDGFKVSRSLRQRIKRGDFEVRFDTAFEQVIRTCALPRPSTGGVWINEQIIDVFVEAHEAGFAHSVEAWGTPRDEDEQARQEREATGDGRVLVGGLYGLALGGVFCGESMFSRATDASKVCLVHLVEHLKSQGFALLDSQMNNDHMAQFGTVDIAHEEYLRRLAIALELEVEW